MKTIIHNKLVRDHIPQIIQMDNKRCKVSILHDTAYIEQLKKNSLKKLRRCRKPQQNRKSS